MVIPLATRMSRQLHRPVARARAGDADAVLLLIEPLQAALLRQAVMLSGDPLQRDPCFRDARRGVVQSLAIQRKLPTLDLVYSILLHRPPKPMRRARGPSHFIVVAAIFSS